MLFILTICDIRAVGPGVWNHWKGELLRTLYWETEVVLAGGHSTIDRRRRVAQAQLELRARPAATGRISTSRPMRRAIRRPIGSRSISTQQILHAKLLQHDRSRDARAGDAYRHRPLARRHRTHRHRARSSASLVDHRRRLRRVRGQYRRRAGLHDDRRHGARHHRRVARLRLRRGRTAPRQPHRLRDRAGARRRNPTQRHRGGAQRPARRAPEDVPAAAGGHHRQHAVDAHAPSSKSPGSTGRVCCST